MSRQGARIGRGETSASRSAGFTLIEMLIAMTMFAAMLAIAFPNMVDILMGAKMRSAVNQFVSAHSLTRPTALSSSGWRSCCGRRALARRARAAGWACGSTPSLS